MWRRPGKCSLTLFGFLLVTHGTTALAQNDPTPQEIRDGWAALSGGIAGKVVYWEADKIRILDLTTGTNTAIADHSPWDWASMPKS